jgi:hypothetical protein
VRTNLIAVLMAVAAIAGATSSATKAEPVEECGLFSSPSRNLPLDFAEAQIGSRLRSG